MLKSQKIILWIGLIIFIPALFYSVPRLCYFPQMRYNRIVMNRIEKDDVYHIQRHQELIDKMTPEAKKGAAVFVFTLCLVTLGVYLAKSKPR